MLYYHVVATVIECRNVAQKIEEPGHLHLLRCSVRLYHTFAALDPYLVTNDSDQLSRFIHGPVRNQLLLFRYYVLSSVPSFLEQTTVNHLTELAQQQIYSPTLATFSDSSFRRCSVFGCFWLARLLC